MSDVTLTVKELKHWLQGVEDMQDEGWCPTQGQWKKIRDKIFLLDETSVQSTHVPQNVGGFTGAASVTEAPVITYRQAEAAQPNPITYQNSGVIPQAPIPQGPVFIPPHVPMSGGMNDGQMVTTPSIDTSSGKYESSFA